MVSGQNIISGTIDLLLPWNMKVIWIEANEEGSSSSALFVKQERKLHPHF